jgi:hypothetical protein
LVLCCDMRLCSHGRGDRQQSSSCCARSQRSYAL